MPLPQAQPNQDIQLSETPNWLLLIRILCTNNGFSFG
jgi:hypothetical protein